LLTPYNECLVRFMLEKETNDFNERLIKEREAVSNKSKYKKT